MRPRPDPAGPGQESVWDYPRPPRLERTPALLEVVLDETVVARTREGWRVLETSHPPTYYLPRDSFVDGTLVPTGGASWCEWKGQASYFDVVSGARMAAKAAWTYAQPTAGFEQLAGAVAVMAGLVDECRVDGEVVTPQPGGFYGGWVTRSVAGPVKGVPGSTGW